MLPASTGHLRLRIWWNIVLPMTKATLAALAIFIFLNSWNDFLVASGHYQFRINAHRPGWP